MELRILSNGNLQMDDAKIIFKNFAGRGGKYNREGDRNFSVKITDPDIADVLIENGWNVKIKPPYEEGDMPDMTLKVKVKFSKYGPNVYLQSGDARRKLTEKTVDIIDRINIDRVDLDIRPFDSEVQGKEWRTAYLDNILVYQRLNRFATEDECDSYDDDDDTPF